MLLVWAGARQAQARASAGSQWHILSHAELYFHVLLRPAGGAEAAQPGSDATAQQRDEDSAAAAPDLPGAHTSAADGGAGRGGGCGLGGNADVAVARAQLLYHCGSHQVPAGCRLLNNEAPNTTPQFRWPRGGVRKRSRDTVPCRASATSCPHG